MFTGIVEEIGTLSRIERGSSFCQLAISARRILDDCKAGDSIAINGACLTVTRRHSDGFAADVMAETMRRTNLENLKVGEKVNLAIFRAFEAQGIQFSLPMRVTHTSVDSQERPVEVKMVGQA